MRLDQERVEVPGAKLGCEELDDAVDSVQRDSTAERRQREPVEPLRAAGEQRHAGDEGPEVEQELHHPLRPLRQRLVGVEVEVADEVDEEERGEEREPDDRGSREPPVSSLEAIPQEAHEEPGGQDVGEREVGGELPVDLRERDEEDRGEEEGVDRGLREDALAWCRSEGDRGGRHGDRA